ncbi:hypothetical protein ACP70R_047255 [Stipagrostis hirtigluma subsp. patula]
MKRSDCGLSVFQSNNPCGPLGFSVRSLPHHSSLRDETIIRNTRKHIESDQNQRAGFHGRQDSPPGLPFIRFSPLSITASPSTSPPQNSTARVVCTSSILSSHHSSSSSPLLYMSKGRLLCALLLLQACFLLRLSVPASSRRLAGGQIGTGGVSLCQDPIRRPGLMLSPGGDELGSGGSADSILDDELSDEGVLVGDEYASDDGGSSVPPAGEADAEEEEGQLLLRGDDDDDHDDSGGLKDSSGGSGGDVECPECGKFFKNDKSMFGHLRSHPNRGYKGATPPIKKLKLSLDTDASSPAPSSPGVDRPPARHSQRDPRLTPFETLCACVMYTLRYRGRQTVQQAPPPPPSFSEQKQEAIELADGAGIGALVTSNTGAEVKGNAGPDVNNPALGDDQGGPPVKVPKKRRRNKPKEVIGAQRKEKPVPRTKEKRPYICKHCKAEFSTHQALGGHMAGHHRDKRSQVPLNDKATLTPYPGAVGQSQDGKQAEGGTEYWRDGLLPSSRRLQADQFSMKLNMGWQSGQAPGGHHRQQFDRMNSGLLPVAVAPPSAVGGNRPRLLDIDLNVEAPDQD